MLQNFVLAWNILFKRVSLDNWFVTSFNCCGFDPAHNWKKQTAKIRFIFPLLRNDFQIVIVFMFSFVSWQLNHCYVYDTKINISDFRRLNPCVESLWNNDQLLIVSHESAGYSRSVGENLFNLHLKGNFK